MAVTDPIMLDSTGQDIVNSLGSTSQDIVNSLSNIQNAINGQCKISAGTDELQDGVSYLPSGEVYLWYPDTGDDSGWVS